MNNTLSKKAIKLVSVTILASLISACSIPLGTSDQPIEKWTDGQLLEQASKNFAKKNYNESYDYLFQLSKRNNKEGLYALGYSYYYGLGVDKNEATAQDLIRQSAALGYKPAIKALRLFMASKIAFISDTKKASYMAHGDEKNAKADTTPTKVENNNIDNKVAAVKQNKMKLNTLQEIINSDLNKNTNNNNQIATAEKKSPVDSIIKNTILPSTNTANTTAENHTKNKEIKNIKENKDIWKAIEEAPQAKNLIDNKISKKTQTTVQPEAPQTTAWLKSQDPNNYTIQITASKNKDEISKFIIANNLQDKAEAFAYLNDDKVWYGVGLGVYDNQSDAYRALLKDVPSSAKGNKPWVRQFKNIHAIG